MTLIGRRVGIVREILISRTGVVRACACWVVDVATWQSYFVHGASCAARLLPPKFARVTFIANSAGPRGPVGFDVRMLAPPTPVLRYTCPDCREEFSMDPAEQAWFLDFKGYRLPLRCRSCRRRRRADVSPIDSSELTPS
jgi:hypothetical protein